MSEGVNAAPWTMTDAATHHPPRRWWFFSLKDRMPLGADGWTVIVHQPDCQADDGAVACLDGEPCYAHVVKFLGFPTVDESLNLGMSDITSAIAIVNGRAPRDELPSLPDGFPDHRWVIVVSVVESDDQPVMFDDAFGLVVDAVTALRNATGVAVPDPSIERVQPMYMMGLQRDGGEVVPWNTVIVDHVIPGPPPPATAEQLADAELMLLGRLRRNPVEQYRTFSTRARTAAQEEGDYERAVLSSAIACEVLIKTVAWMLTHEASLMDVDPTPVTTNSPLHELKPSQLIGQVLQPRLGGNWDSTNDGRPVREWRVRVASKRNALLHLGDRPSGADADGALHGMKLLTTHLMDCLAEKATVYPRTAYALVGPNGLKRRNRLAPVLAALESVTPDPDDWIASYVGFVEGLLGVEL